MRWGLNMLLFGTEVEQWGDDLLSQLAAAGYQHLEVPVFELNEDRLHAFKKRTDSHGFTLSVCGVFPEGASLAEGDAEAEAACRITRDLLRGAEILEAKMAIGPLYHPVGVHLLPHEPEEHQQRMIRHLRDHIAPLYERAGVRLALEPLNRFETNLINTHATAVAIAEAVNSPAIGMMGDTFHAHIEENSPDEAMANLGNHCFNFHLSESHRGIAGTGQVRWSEWLPHLRDRDLLVFESFSGGIPALATATCVWRDLTGDPVDCARRSLRFLREALEACAS